MFFNGFALIIAYRQTISWLLCFIYPPRSKDSRERDGESERPFSETLSYHDSFNKRSYIHLHRDCQVPPPQQCFEGKNTQNKHTPSPGQIQNTKQQHHFKFYPKPFSSESSKTPTLIWAFCRPQMAEHALSQELLSSNGRRSVSYLYNLAQLQFLKAEYDSAAENLSQALSHKERVIKFRFTAWLIMMLCTNNIIAQQCATLQVWAQYACICSSTKATVYCVL